MAALRASYHRILDRIEHMLPAKLRPLYNHPAGKSHYPISSQTGWVVVQGDGCVPRPAVTRTLVEVMWVAELSCGG